jgi:hypothetical protein
VVEAAGEMVGGGGGELLGSVELAAGSGSNWMRLPPMGCSQRKRMAAELPLPGFASRHRGQVLGAGGVW